MPVTSRPRWRSAGISLFRQPWRVVHRRARNGDLLEIFNPGQGICAAATLDPSGTRLYILSNGGSLYALDGFESRVGDSFLGDRRRGLGAAEMFETSNQFLDPSPPPASRTFHATPNPDSPVFSPVSRWSWRRDQAIRASTGVGTPAGSAIFRTTRSRRPGTGRSSRRHRRDRCRAGCRCSPAARPESAHHGRVQRQSLMASRGHHQGVAARHGQEVVARRARLARNSTPIPALVLVLCLPGRRHATVPEEGRCCRAVPGESRPPPARRSPPTSGWYEQPSLRKIVEVPLEELGDRLK